MKAKEVFKPMKDKLALSIAFFVFNMFILSAFFQCPFPTIGICPVEAGTPGATFVKAPPGANFPDMYVVPAERVPFSCEEVCPGEEYNSALTSVLVIILVIGILSYLIASMLIFRTTGRVVHSRT